MKPRRLIGGPINVGAGGVQGLIPFSEGGGSHQWSSSVEGWCFAHVLLTHYLFLHPFHFTRPLIPTATISKYTISFRCHNESFLGSF